MADNYLEKQYEQYEAKKAAWEKARKLGKRKDSATAVTETKQSDKSRSKSEETDS